MLSDVVIYNANSFVSDIDTAKKEEIGLLPSFHGQSFTTNEPAAFVLGEISNSPFIIYIFISFSVSIDKCSFIV